jgi:hypothetical protein
MVDSVEPPVDLVKLPAQEIHQLEMHCPENNAPFR